MSLLSDAEAMAFDKLPSVRRPASRKKLLVVSFLVLSILGSVILLFGSSPSSSLSSLHLSMSPRYIMTFTKHDELFDMTPAGDGNWTALLPPNGGFLVVPDNKDGFEMAGITMFHQLHCLMMIRSAMQDYMGISRESKLGRERHDGNGILGRGHSQTERSHSTHRPQNHWVHCLDYLMQVRLRNLDAGLGWQCSIS
jgi:hypothetical protein